MLVGWLVCFALLSPVAVDMTCTLVPSEFIMIKKVITRHAKWIINDGTERGKHPLSPPSGLGAWHPALLTKNISFSYWPPASRSSEGQINIYLFTPWGEGSSSPHSAVAFLAEWGRYWKALTSICISVIGKGLVTSPFGRLGVHMGYKQMPILWQGQLCQDPAWHSWPVWRAATDVAHHCSTGFGPLPLPGLQGLNPAGQWSEVPGPNTGHMSESLGNLIWGPCFTLANMHLKSGGFLAYITSCHKHTDMCCDQAAKTINRNCCRALWGHLWHDKG